MLFSFKCFQFVAGQPTANYRDIMNEIFVTNGYDKRIRPANISETVFVDVNLDFEGILDLKEVDQKLKSTGFFYIGWVDPGLTWSSSLHGGIRKINIPQGDIWKPDIVMGNGLENFNEMGSNFNFVQVFSEGFVAWTPSQVFESRCSIDITYFPFDRQSCDLAFLIWSFSSTEVEIYSSKGIDYPSNFREHSSWKLLSANTTVDNKYSYESKIYFTLELQRKPLYYVTNILLPVILLCGLVIGVFLIPVESGEKISYSVTILLAMSVFLSIVSTILPRNSDDVCLLAVYLLINLILGVLAVVFTIFQFRLLHRTDNVPRMYAMICVSKKSCRKAIFRKKSRVVSTNALSLENETCNSSSELSWEDVVKMLDVIFFWTFFILFFVSTSVILGKLIAYYYGY